MWLQFDCPIASSASLCWSVKLVSFAAHIVPKRQCHELCKYGAIFNRLKSLLYLYLSALLRESFIFTVYVLKFICCLI